MSCMNEKHHPRFNRHSLNQSSEVAFATSVATTEVQNAWSSRDSRRLQIVPGSALVGNSNCKNRVTELRFLVISRQ